MSESRETSTPINAPKSTIELSILLFRSFKHGTRREGENEHENPRTRVSYMINQELKYTGETIVCYGHTIQEVQFHKYSMVALSREEIPQEGFEGLHVE